MVCGLAAIVHSFGLLLVGSALLGFTTAANGLARYTAVDLARPEHRGRALSLVVWSTTIGAVAGPSLTGPAASAAGALGGERLAGPFLFGALGMLVSLGILTVFLRPDPLRVAQRRSGVAPAAGRAVASPRAIRDLLGAHPRVGAAVGTIALAHAVMVAVMVMTPLHMRHGGADLRIIGVTISLHVLGMFGFSPLVGMACDRWGAPRLMIAGAAVLVVAAIASGASHQGASPLIAAGLFLLGVGWSLATVASATLLSAAAPDDVRTETQGAGDLVMGLAGATAGALAGVVMAVSGYLVLNAFAASLAVAAGAAAWSVCPRRTPA